VRQTPYVGGMRSYARIALLASRRSRFPRPFEQHAPLHHHSVGQVPGIEGQPESHGITTQGPHPFTGPTVRPAFGRRSDSIRSFSLAPTALRLVPCGAADLRIAPCLFDAKAYTLHSKWAEALNES
jgi:hypothetical protein